MIVLRLFCLLDIAAGERIYKRRDFKNFPSIFASLKDECESDEPCNIEKLSLLTNLTIDFEPNSVLSGLRTDEKPISNLERGELYSSLENLIDRRQRVVEKEQPPPVLKGFKTLPKYSKFLVRSKPNIQLKSAGSGRSGPTIERLGSGPLKTVFIVEHIVNERGVYYLQEKPHDTKPSFQLNFYTKPTEKYNELVYICELTRDLTRWAIMRRPCIPEKGINYGYKAYASSVKIPGSVRAVVSNNRAVGMPFGTRISSEPPCCKGQKFKGFEPCCHYRHDPFDMFLPSGWSKWSAWSACSATCDGGRRSRSRRCSGIGMPESDCAGDAEEEGDCGTLPCNPIGWAEWTQWGECSKTCGGGVQFRERVCSDICPNKRSYHKEPRNCAVFRCLAANIWGEWNNWADCSATCELGRTYRRKRCDDGPCLTDKSQTPPMETKDCFDKFCNYWSDWGEWSACSRECNSGTRESRRKCVDGVAGLQGCPGSDFLTESCNTEQCEVEAEPETNAWGIKKYFSHHTLNSFQQECLDYHNFFRALHNLEALRWDPDLWQTSKLWSKKLIAVAPASPKETSFRTNNWPHSNVDSEFRPANVGENIAWDLSAEGSSCAQAVFRWYSERFYYNPSNQKSRRPGEPVGHVTQLLWKSSTAVGCSRTQKLIKQPPGVSPKYQRSSYIVCHYSPQGNIIGLMEKNWSPLDDRYCSTYNILTGKNTCRKYGTCQGLEEKTKCGCNKRKTGVIVPLCMGRCLVECYNQWRTPNYYPSECVGTKFCTCGKNGAYCK